LKFKGKVEPNLRITTADWQPPQQSWSAKSQTYEQNTVPSENDNVLAKWATKKSW
jgi:hypothetical protein